MILCDRRFLERLWRATVLTLGMLLAANSDSNGHFLGNYGNLKTEEDECLSSAMVG